MNMVIEEIDAARCTTTRMIKRLEKLARPHTQRKTNIDYPFFNFPHHFPPRIQFREHRAAIESTPARCTQRTIPTKDILARGSNKNFFLSTPTIEG